MLAALCVCVSAYLVDGLENRFVLFIKKKLKVIAGININIAKLTLLHGGGEDCHNRI